MKKYTMQSAFDKVWNHFSKESAKPAYDGWSCVYRLNNNPNAKTRCAMGVLIPNKLYDPEMEGTAASGILDYEGIRELFDRGMREGFLDELQSCHDREAANLDIRTAETLRLRILENLRRLATRHCLEVPSETV